MKKLILSLVAIATIALNSFGQAPEGFKYQAVVRDAGNTILNNQAVGMRMTIQQGSIGGTTVYQETFLPTTNAYGLVNLEIGNGTAVSGDFTTIDWSAGPYFIETAVDVTGGTSYAVMGTSQLMSVPYALHANTAENVTNDLVDDADADPNNEIQAVSFSNDTLYLSNGGQVYLGSYGVDLVDDADADPNNEIQDLQLLGNILTITNNGTATSIDLSSYLDNTDTQLDETAVDAFVSNNGYITSPNDADADPNNEIQTISRTGTTVTLSNGGTFEDSVGVYTAGTGIDITNNVISTTGPCVLSIGDTYQGGIIFYLDASGCHGLIAASTDQSAFMQWYNGSYVDTYAYGNGIGAGEGNTQGIRRWQGVCSSCYASQRCQDLSLGGYFDWYLPSKYELNLMYENIGQGNALGLGNVGNFASFYYWSSTEGGEFGAWRQKFSDGIQSTYTKNFDCRVRAVRAF
ncbi:DUF1566 domain-containing protein [Crocinitomicaceae bacterium]|nr:DUF1566 domain-containing protein [Crocinitomicaceae bacterium]